MMLYRCWMWEIGCKDLNHAALREVLPSMYLSPNNFKPTLPEMTNTGSLFIKGHSGDSIPLFARLEERGFTFVEVLVAIVVLALLFIPISMIFTSSLAGMARACRRTAASNLCRDKMELSLIHI